MVSAVWKDKAIDTIDETIVVEVNHYFPPSTSTSLLEETGHTSVCPIKGTARYFNVRVGNALNGNAARAYPGPTPVIYANSIMSLSGKAWTLRRWTKGGFVDGRAPSSFGEAVD